MNLIRKSVLPLLILGAMFMQSCKDDTTGTGNTGGNTVTNKKPAAGSTYTYDRTTTQSGTQVDATTNTYTALILDSMYGGKSGVYVFKASIGDTADKFIAYESNGNVSIPAPSLDLEAGTATIKWMTLPITGSGGSNNQVIFNGKLDLGLFQADVKLVVSAAYVGEESITINGTSYKAKKIKTTTDATFDFGAGPVGGTDDDYLWWVPELGFYSRMEEGGGTDPTSGEQDALHVESLTTFDLK